MFHHLFFPVISVWHTTISLDSCFGMPCLLKGKKSEPVNYRPVSHTAIPCKIMEHCIVSNIWSHLNKHSIITSKQHGFRRGMSCKTQLIEATYDWTTFRIYWSVKGTIISKKANRTGDLRFNVINRNEEEEWT